MPPRFVKHRRGEIMDAPEDQLRRLCLEVTGHEVESIEAYDVEPRSTFGWNRFVRSRKKDRERMAGRPGMGFRITFAQEVEGPISLGYGAHFGLGQFRPTR
jgi:CRISPR-associated protein Csb2